MGDISSYYGNNGTVYDLGESATYIKEEEAYITQKLGSRMG